MNIHLHLNSILKLRIFENGIEVTDEKLLREINTFLEEEVYYLELQEKVIFNSRYFTSNTVPLYTVRFEVTNVTKCDYGLY